MRLHFYRLNRVHLLYSRLSLFVMLATWSQLFKSFENKQLILRCILGLWLTQLWFLPFLIMALQLSLGKLPLPNSRSLWLKWDWACYQFLWEYMWLRTDQSATLPSSNWFFLLVTGSGRGMRTRLGIFARETRQERTPKLEGGKLGTHCLWSSFYQKGRAYLRMKATRKNESWEVRRKRDS